MSSQAIATPAKYKLVFTQEFNTFERAELERQKVGKLLRAMGFDITFEIRPVKI